MRFVPANRQRRQGGMGMADEMQCKAGLFDFSLDAEDFKVRLWKNLEKQMTEDAVQPLDDDDLEWVSAAGMTVRGEKDENFD